MRVLRLGLTVVWWLPHCGWVCAVVCLVGLLGLFAWFIVVVILGWAMVIVWVVCV